MREFRLHFLESFWRGSLTRSHATRLHAARLHYGGMHLPGAWAAAGGGGAEAGSIGGPESPGACARSGSSHPEFDGKPYETCGCVFCYGHMVENVRVHVYA